MAIVRGLERHAHCTQRRSKARSGVIFYVHAKFPAKHALVCNVCGCVSRHMWTSAHSCMCRVHVRLTWRVLEFDGEGLHGGHVALSVSPVRACPHPRAAAARVLLEFDQGMHCNKTMSVTRKLNYPLALWLTAMHHKLMLSTNTIDGTGHGDYSSMASQRMVSCAHLYDP